VRVDFISFFNLLHIALKSDPASIDDSYQNTGFISEHSFHIQALDCCEWRIFRAEIKKSC
jgi:hypothetical protein